MHFCPACDNKLNMQIGQINASESAPSSYSIPLTLYCKHCPFTTSINSESSSEDDELLKTFDPCMYRSNYSNNHPLYYSTIVNQYTFDDPTLPCFNNKPCANSKCASHTTGIMPEILYLRYNDQDLKYLYLCKTCKSCWHYKTTGENQECEMLFDFSKKDHTIHEPAKTSSITI